MAEWVMKRLVKEAGMDKDFTITSAAVSYEEQGNDIYPPAKRKMTEKGIPFGHHSAHRITSEEFAENDFVIVMDESNKRLLSRIAHEKSGKVRMLLEFTGQCRDVADPWYTGDFEQAFNDILNGCRALLSFLNYQNL